MGIKLDAREGESTLTYMLWRSVPDVPRLAFWIFTLWRDEMQEGGFALCSVVNDFHSKPNPCLASAMELLVVIMIEVQDSAGYAA